MTKVTKLDKRLTNQQLDNAPTNEILLRRTGLLAEGDWSFQNYAVIAILMSGFLHYFGKVAFELEYLDLLGLMKSLHLASIYFFVAVGSSGILVNSHIFLEMKETFLNGFRFYKRPDTEQQRAIKLERNQTITRNTKIFIAIYLAALVSTVLKEHLPHDFEEWRRNYSGWFPITINSWTRYIISQIYHAIIAIFLDACSCTFFTVFVTSADNICAQIQILDLAFKDTFDPALNPPTRKNHQEKLKDDVICCIKHHIEILRCINKLQKCYKMVFVAVLQGASVILCTMAYILTDPKTNFNTGIALLALGIPEVTISMFYCLYGQKLTNLSDKFRATVYNKSYWYAQPLEIRYYILMMLLRTRKTVTLSAGGILNCNLEGYQEIVQGTWAYFNMLRAFRAKAS